MIIDKGKRLCFHVSVKIIDQARKYFSQYWRQFIFNSEAHSVNSKDIKMNVKLYTFDVWNIFVMNSTMYY